MTKTASMTEIKLWAMIDKTITASLHDCLNVELAGGVFVVFDESTGTAVIRVGDPKISKKSSDFYFARHGGKEWKILAKLSVNPDHGTDTCFGDQYLYDAWSRTVIVSEPYFNDGVIHAFTFDEAMTEVVEFDAIVCDLEESDKPEGYKTHTKFPTELSEASPIPGMEEGTFSFTVASKFVNDVRSDKYYREVGGNCIMMDGAFDSESTNKCDET